MKLNLQENMDQKIDIDTQEIIMIIKEVYSLPKLSKQNKFMKEEMIQIKSKINRIYKLFKYNEKDIHNETDNFDISTHVHELKRKLYEQLICLFPNLPIYLIVKKIHQNNISFDLRICEELMYDMISTKKEHSHKEEIKNITENIFNKLDINKTGTIMIEELKIYFNQSGFNISESVYNSCIKKSEIIENGHISKEDFIKHSTRHIEKYYKIFFNLDFDNDSKLNYKQLQQTLYEVYVDIDFDEHFQNIFTMMNPDENGQVSFEEWCKFLIFFHKNNFRFMVEYFDFYKEREKLELLNSIDNHKEENTVKMIINTSKSSIFIYAGIFGTLTRIISHLMQKIKKIKFDHFFLRSGLNFTKSSFISIFVKFKQLNLISYINITNSSIIILEKTIQFSVIEYYLTRSIMKSDKYRPLDILKLSIFSSAINSLAVYPFIYMSRHKKYLKNICKSTKLNCSMLNIKGINGIRVELFSYFLTSIFSSSINIFIYLSLKNILLNRSDNENFLNYGKYFGLGAISGLVTGISLNPIKILSEKYLNRRPYLVNSIHQYSSLKSNLYKMVLGQSLGFGGYEITKSLFPQYM